MSKNMKNNTKVTLTNVKKSMKIVAKSTILNDLYNIDFATRLERKRDFKGC